MRRIAAGAELPNIFDNTKLAEMNARARRDPEGTVKIAAKQFEAYFINLLLKQARASLNGSLLDSQQSKFFTEMYDQQLALTMANNGGFGFADMMVKQLTQQNAARQSMDAALSALSADTNEARALRSSATPETISNKQAELPVNQQTKSEASESQVSKSAAASRGLAQYAATQALVDEEGLSWDVGAVAPRTPRQYANISGTPGTPEAFIEEMLPFAEEAARITGIPAKFLVAHAGLETGWGKRQILRADGTNSHNLFGIKATGNWRGDVANALTTEYENGQAKRKTEPFRAYDSYADCFADYARLLSGNSRYAGALNQSDPEKFAQSLQDGGYATDPNYAKKLKNIILARNLL